MIHLAWIFLKLFPEGADGHGMGNQASNPHADHPSGFHVWARPLCGFDKAFL